MITKKQIQVLQDKLDGLFLGGADRTLLSRLRIKHKKIQYYNKIIEKYKSVVEKW